MGFRLRFFHKTNTLFAMMISILIILSCQKSSKYIYDHSLFIGTYRAMDLTIPYPYFIEDSGHHVRLLNHSGRGLDSSMIKQNMAKDDTLSMHHHNFEIMYVDSSKLHLFQLDDTLHFPQYAGQKIWKYRAKMVPTIETKPLMARKIKQSLLSQTFTIDTKSENPNDYLKVTKYLTFGNDSMTTRYVYQYSDKVIFDEYQVQKYTVFNIGTKAFLSCNEIVENPQPISQVLESGHSKLVLRYFEGDEEVIVALKDVSLPHGAPKSFANCFDGHVGEYYHNTQDVTYKYGNEFLMQKIMTNAPIDHGDGYIIIHFNINCHDQMGRPGLLMMDKKYQPRTFSEPLVSHIIEQVMELKEWPSSVSEYGDYLYKDVHGFLMFKIESGKISDLCP
jgi:hypothetical protein